MEGRRADRPTGHGIALASAGLSRVPEPELAPRSTCTKDSGGDNYLDQGNGRQQPAVGVTRIQGELLKLDITVAKRTIQRYIRHAAAEIS